MNSLPPTKYHHKTRIGNWYEEQELEETRLKDFLKYKDIGGLASAKLQQKLDHSLSKASLTYSRDGYVHFDDHLMLCNQKTNGCLVTNIYDRIADIDEAYVATTAKNATPTARSVFIIKRYERDLHTDNIVHYGQKIRIQVNPLLLKKQAYLYSVPISPQHVAKNSRKQETGFHVKDNYNSVWIVEHIDPKIRFEMNGQRVNAGEAVLLRHGHTAQWLASDEYGIKNEFGTEYEVFGHSFQSLNKSQNLIAEKTGRTTIDIPSRNQYEQNGWVLVLAADPSQEFDEALLAKELEAPDYVKLISQAIREKGSYGLRALRIAFQKIGEGKTTKLEKDDFAWGLRNAGIILNNKEINAVFSFLDREQKGLVDYNDLLDVLQAPVKENRRKLIVQTYQSLAKAYGPLTIEKLVAAFDVPNHPDVHRRLKTDKEAFREFTSGWIFNDVEDPVSEEDFYNFYADVSTGIPKDDEFEILLRSSWKC
mmetsp:Transcript_50155/g.57704  ORF Transcript_50155/g.57704 Transcript_50155/m.57704 type:complete len:479 (+) Transcript_50155:40-1476(+)|eukprot:CAMPEP_0176435132 /NCGR_PEP_ID=MMETSP0127-20121128/17119_1 /TAXON_ID=938130 /ORGANISM="Platyophrya macrostoma, Strain WH" /LENGTH=478 /DNA_ID=CAMNT_0017818059 /DNA_START=29 /DNA_END=1465 /DNA_ORIENTATION=+